MVRAALAFFPLTPLARSPCAHGNLLQTKERATNCYGKECATECAWEAPGSLKISHRARFQALMHRGGARCDVRREKKGKNKRYGRRIAQRGCIMHSRVQWRCTHGKAEGISLRSIIVRCKRLFIRPLTRQQQANVARRSPIAANIVSEPRLPFLSPFTPLRFLSGRRCAADVSPTRALTHFLGRR